MPSTSTREFLTTVWYQRVLVVEILSYPIFRSVPTITYDGCLRWMHSGEDSDFSDCYDCNVISGLLKLYLRELPESIFTRELGSHFNVAAGMYYFLLLFLLLYLLLHQHHYHHHHGCDRQLMRFWVCNHSSTRPRFAYSGTERLDLRTTYRKPSCARVVDDAAGAGHQLR